MLEVQFHSIWKIEFSFIYESSKSRQTLTNYRLIPIDFQLISVGLHKSLENEAAALSQQPMNSTKDRNYL